MQQGSGKIKILAANRWRQSRAYIDKEIIVLVTEAPSFEICRPTTAGLLHSRSSSLLSDQPVIRTKRFLLFQRDGVLSDLIEGGDGFGIGFEAALSDDQVGEFGGDVDVGQFERAAGERAQLA